jgi:glycosyltransferase involved in cell wall biosynthesis
MKPPFRTLVITSGLDTKKPWWWDHIEHDSVGCQLDHHKILLKGGRISSVISLRFIAFVFQILSILMHARHRYHNILTFECGWESFLVAFVQTLTCSRRPRHVILQFIMREKDQGLASRVKYLFMRWCFSSVHLCVCSSRAESQYYQQVFGWPSEKVLYTPLHTDPRLLNREISKVDDFVLSAGRTFRDYGTLLAAFRQLEVPLLIVASPWNIDPSDRIPNVQIQYDLPGCELIEIMSRCLAVVVPLEDRVISVGQSVVLQAMTLGKPIIATRVNGTVDYIEHMKTGILVPPKDIKAIKDAVSLLVGNEELRSRLGRAAQDRVKEMYLPDHYAKAVSDRLQSVT